MFDIGWSEMVFVAIIAVLVVGPKDLPRAVATVGKYVRKMRSMARDFQSGMDDLARDAELDDLKKTVQGDDFNIKKQVENAVDPDGDFATMFDKEVEAEEKAETEERAEAESQASSSEQVDTASSEEAETENKVSS